MTILRTCPKQEAASSTCCSRAMDVIAQGLSRPARRMGDDAPSQLHGLGATQRLWDSCCNGACDLSSAQVAGTGLAHACSNGGHGWSQPNVSSLRDQCPHNLHWQVRIRRICEPVSRAGGTPVVVAGVRSPFGYYVSHYFYALHAQQQHRDPPHRRLGAAWFSSKHAVCLQKKPKRAA